jgi:hypothetical protein
MQANGLNIDARHAIRCKAGTLEIDVMGCGVEPSGEVGNSEDTHDVGKTSRAPEMVKIGSGSG